MTDVQPDDTLTTLTVVCSERAPVLTITAAGRIIWRDREVETDDALRAAMLALKDAILPPDQVECPVCNHGFRAASASLRDHIRRLQHAARMAHAALEHGVRQDQEEAMRLLREALP